MAVLVALPLTRATGLPKLLPSLWNCTVPVGVPLVEVTLVVKVTAWP